MIKKVSGIIIKDNKILLVTSRDQSFYWTPGGKIEGAESAAEALERELKEELNISINKATPYFTYNSLIEEDNKPREVQCFLVEYSDEPICSAEITSLVWASGDDLKNGFIPLQTGVKLHLIPKLLSDKLLV